jgi:predicted nucleic acid-binding protein
MESLLNIPNNISVFIDANIFIYHFCSAGDVISERCSDFLNKVENEQIRAFTSTFVIAEVLHRAMIHEAVGKTGLNPKGAMNKLQKDSDLIKSLNQFSQIPIILTDIGIQVLTVSYTTILNSYRWRHDYGMMVNDSILLATMASFEISHLVTNDSDFDRIRDIQLWKPVI